MVCLETFTKQPSRRQAKCPYCDVKACVKCTQTYLLGITEDPHCMGCRKAWSRSVLDELLLVGWLNGEYKKRRENILLDRERSRLPAAQIIIERQKEAEERVPNLQILEKEIAKINRELDAAIHRLHREQTIISDLRAGRAPTTSGGVKTSTEPKRQFVMPCPAANCRGFLSSAYKCGVCDIYCCSQCREVKGKQHDAPHECNPDVVKSVEALKKQCRNCPECGTSIFRVEGCAQMFCTQCNTPFDWTTGKKITTGAIHNPHYFEYLRKVGGGDMPRNPGDIPCGGRLPEAWAFQSRILMPIEQVIKETYVENDTKKLATELKKNVRMLYDGLRWVHHVQLVEIPRNTNNAEDMDNTDYNLRYLKQEIDEKRWKQLLQQKEKRRMKREEVRQVLEAFCATCVDIYAPLLALTTQSILNTERGRITYTIPSMDTFKSGIEKAMKQITSLRKIFNHGMLEISRRFKCQVPSMDDNLRIRSTKYSRSTGIESDPDEGEEETSATNVLVPMRAD